MLVELRIRDLALIEELELSFGPGFTAVSGETGAGKSLLVGSLELLLGRTPRGGAKGWVRQGAEEARVEARLLLSDGPVGERVRAHMAEALPAIAEESDDASELILGRTLTRDGRTRAHVNQRPVPLKALRELAPLCLEIHGQNEHQRLLEAGEQRRLLDSFGALEPELAAYRAARTSWRALGARLRALAAERVERRDRLDLLHYQVGELEQAGLEPGEHASLKEEREVLRHAGELRGELGSLRQELIEDDGALIDRLKEAERVLERWAPKLERLRAAAEDLTAARVHLEEGASQVSDVLGSVEDDPRRLEGVEERLAELERLERKYGRDEAGLEAHAGELRAQSAELEADEAGEEDLTRELVLAHKALEMAAGALGKRRAKIAPELVAAVGSSLEALGLGAARFEVALEARSGTDEERFAPAGTEDVEFRLGANPGEPLAPLAAVASGGEAARIMLALRTVLSRADHGRTLVFDEIDSGVGGRLGPAVGAHMEELAVSHQVLCVTHVPAIAARAATHYHAHKTVEGGRTRTEVTRLEGKARVAEVADMIAGGAGEKTALAEARRLLAAR